MSQAQGATAAGTAAYRDRLSGLAAPGHFREAQGLWVSSIGLGTYLGHYDDRTDAAYCAAVERAAGLGDNVFDTAANYRFQRSERSVGAALAGMFAAGALSRPEVVVTTKGGYLPFDGEPPRGREEMERYLDETFVRTGVCRREDFVQGSHCMTPGYLAHQLEQSRRNLGLETVDVYYIHNPESQLAGVSREEFDARLGAAFEFLESAVEAGKILYYGTATWSGYRVAPESPEFLSLESVVGAARAVAGEGHHCRVVQLPFNLAMLEAFTLANQPVGRRRVTLLEAAAELGVTVMASASILQGRLAADLSDVIGGRLGEFRTDAQRAIQFTRSTPGVTTALVGMSRVAHVEENLEVAAVPPAAPADYLQLFTQA